MLLELFAFQICVVGAVCNRAFSVIDTVRYILYRCGIRWTYAADIAFGKYGMILRSSF